jgi:hypothetical protein
LTALATRPCGRAARPAIAAAEVFGWSNPVLDVVYVAGILALIALIALIGKAVEKL